MRALKALARTQRKWRKGLIRHGAKLVRPIVAPTDWYLRRYIRNSGGRLPADLPRLGWMNTVLKSKDQIELACREVQRCGLISHADRRKHWDALSALRFILDRRGTSARVLEVGATLYSVMLPWLYQYGFRRLRGIDLVFDRPVRRGSIVYEHGDLTRTHFRDASFDIVCSMSVIEHGVALASYFAEMARLLGPGGILITSTDYWKDPVDTRGQVAFDVPIKIFTPEEIHQLVRVGESFGFVPTGPIDLDCLEPTVTWEEFNLDYSFLCFALEKKSP